jgi:hypothetical protein
MAKIFAEDYYLVDVQSKRSITENVDCQKNKYVDNVNNKIHQIDVYSNGNKNGRLKINTYGPETLLEDIRTELCKSVIAMVKGDLDLTVEKVYFFPKNITVLKELQSSYVEFSSQPTIVPDPEVEDLKKRVAVLEGDVNYLKGIAQLLAQPMRYRQLIGKTRDDLWEAYKAQFKSEYPNGVVKQSYYSKEERCEITHTQPKYWSQFLDFVKDDLAEVPSYWSILYGGNDNDFSEISEVIHCLPDKMAFLKVVHPTGLYADLFAHIYGITVDECLRK